MDDYVVTFYIDGEIVQGGDLHIFAMDEEWAKQVFLLHLNTGEGIPSIYDSYTEPRLYRGEHV